MPNFRASQVSVGVTQNAGRYFNPHVRLVFGNEPAIYMDVDEAILLHRRLGSFLTKHTTPQRRRKVTK